MISIQTDNEAIMQKIRELCREFQVVPYPQHPLDNFAVTLFDTNRYDTYHQSSRPPDPAVWKIPVNAKLVKHVNSDVDGFESLGPNEKYVTNKILYAPPGALLLVVGDLGVGKTRFARYLMESILNQLRHRAASRTKHCPSVIYLDFLDEGLFSGRDIDAARAEFIQRFSDKLEAKINKFFTLTEEVTTIWDAVLKEGAQAGRAPNTAFDYISTRIRLAEAEDSSTDAARQARRQIRNDVAAKGYRLTYLGGLLNYIKTTWFKGHEGCFMVLVDNIDPQPTIVQQAANNVLKEFTRVSGARVVLTARHTTYHQQFGDRGSQAVDAAPFCGVDPLEIVSYRLDEFLSDGARYRELIDPEVADLVRMGIRKIREDAIGHEAFRSLFGCLVGHSVRRGFLLAQNLINTSEYDLAHLGSAPFHINDVLRALIVGSGGVYAWSRDAVVENIFDVHDHKGVSHLIKLRILKAIAAAGGEGLSVSDLIGTLHGFKYSMTLMCSAINDMMEETKGLIWCDRVLIFHNYEDMVLHSDARLHLSPTGRGYETTLFRKMDYIQEVMLDTEVDPHHPTPFGSGWDYRRLQDRFNVVFEFLHRLFIEDRLDVQTFVNDNEASRYRARLGVHGLLSRYIVEGVRETARRILDAAVKGQESRSGGGDMAAFRDEYFAKYDDIISQADEFERHSMRA